MIKLISPESEVPLIWEGDAAIEAIGTDLLAYMRAPEEVATHVALKEGETATRWVCRPLAADVYQRGLQQSRVSCPAGSDGLVLNAAQALSTLPLALVRIENLVEVGDSFTGKKLTEILKRVPWEVKRDIGILAVKMSMGARGVNPINTLASRWVDLSTASRELVDVLADWTDDLDRNAGLAIEAVKEALSPGSTSVDPVSEGAGEDLGK